MQKLILLIFLVSLYSCSSNKPKEFDLESEAVKAATDNTKKVSELKDDILYLTYIDQDKKIKDIPTLHANTLVLKSSITNCESCFDDTMNLLISEKWAEKINLEIWIDHPDLQKLLKEKTWYKTSLNIKFRKINNRLLAKLDSDKLNKPYFFLLKQKDAAISYIYFPELNERILTKRYLNLIVKKFPKA